MEFCLKLRPFYAKLGVIKEFGCFVKCQLSFKNKCAIVIASKKVLLIILSYWLLSMVTILFLTLLLLKILFINKQENGCTDDKGIALLQERRNMQKVNRCFKSEVFSLLLENKANALQVYNALNNTEYYVLEDLNIYKLENAIYLSYVNDASFIIASTLNIYEHQSTVNPNMPLRKLIYISNLIADLVKNENLFGTKLVTIPTPKFVTFYNGLEDMPEVQELKLSDAYEVFTDNPELELKCTVININIGKNKAFLEKCKVIKDYAIFVDLVRQNLEKLTLDDAVEITIDRCIKEHILEDFLKSERVKVMSLSVLEFNLERQLKFEREEGREEGADLKTISQVCKKLIKGKSVEEIADELEEEVDYINMICDIAAKFAPDYDVNKIYKAM